jgi:hypothetical protein
LGIASGPVSISRSSSLEHQTVPGTCGGITETLPSATGCGGPAHDRWTYDLNYDPATSKASLTALTAAGTDPITPFPHCGVLWSGIKSFEGGHLYSDFEVRFPHELTFDRGVPRFAVHADRTFALSQSPSDFRPPPFGQTTVKWEIVFKRLRRSASWPIGALP